MNTIRLAWLFQRIALAVKTRHRKHEAIKGILARSIQTAKENGDTRALRSLRIDLIQRRIRNLKKRQARAKANGNCVTCGNPKPVTNRYYCQSCAVKAKAKARKKAKVAENKRLTKQAIASRRCLECGGKITKKKTTVCSDKCREIRKDRSDAKNRAKRRDNKTK